jgi:hypothetical protein
MLAPRSYRHLITMLTLDLTIPPAAATRARLRQFLIYDDHAAGVAARWLGSEIHSHAARHCAVTSEMWKLEVATRFVLFRETTLQDAGEADVIVVAVNNPGAPEPGFEQWLESLAHERGRSGRDGLLIGLLGGAPDQSGSGDLAKALEACALRAGMEFHGQPAGARADGEADDVRSLVTRLLRDREIID